MPAPAVVVPAPKGAWGRAKLLVTEKVRQDKDKETNKPPAQMADVVLAAQAAGEYEHACVCACVCVYVCVPESQRE